MLSCKDYLSLSGTYLASGSDDLKVVVWDMIRLSPYISFQSGHVSNVFQSKFMPHSNDSQIVTCARDGQVRLAELSVTGSCRETRKICEHADSCHKVGWLVETQSIYIVTCDKSVFICCYEYVQSTIIDSL